MTAVHTCIWVRVSWGYPNTFTDFIKYSISVFKSVHLLFTVFTYFKMSPWRGSDEYKQNIREGLLKGMFRNIWEVYCCPLMQPVSIFKIWVNLNCHTWSVKDACYEEIRGLVLFFFSFFGGGLNRIWSIWISCVIAGTDGKQAGQWLLKTGAGHAC